MCQATRMSMHVTRVKSVSHVFSIELVAGLYRIIYSYVHTYVQSQK